VADAVIALLEPVQKAYTELSDDPAYVTAVFAAGSEHARRAVAPVLAAATAAMGL
jgi:hypothetical protein